MQTNENFRLSNADGISKGITMKDALKYERELEEEKAKALLNPTSEDTLEETTPNTPEVTPTESHDWEKRYSDLKSYVDKQLNAKTQEVNSVKQQNLDLQQKLKVAESKPKNYPFTEAEVKEWADQFPDFHKFMDTVIDMKADKRDAEKDKQIQVLEQQIQSLAAERGRAKLLDLHPDANEIENDPQFISWFDQQEPEIKSLIESPDIKKIAKGLTLYKRDLGIKDKAKASKEADKEASKAITLHTKPDTPKDKKIWKESEVAKMHPRVYAKYADEIEQARLEGRFENDES